MKKQYGWMVVVLLFAGLLVSACGQSSAATTTEEDHPATVEQLEGEEPTRETLTEDAAKRLDIQTAAVQDAEVGGAKRTVIPYAAIIYDTEGATWVYLNPKPLTFVRHPVTVDDIKGDQAFLSDALPAGSAVVTVGVAELYGAESEFEEE
jgi:aromatic ring-cleaving dioxygenase